MEQVLQSLDSRRRFVMTYASVSLVPFTILTFLNSTDISLYMISFILSYLILKMVFKPTYRLKMDILSYILIAIFILLVSMKAVTIFL